MKTYTYETTYEDASTSLEVMFVYTVNFGHPAIMPSFKDELGSPEEWPEIELVSIRVELPNNTGGKAWFAADSRKYDMLSDWFDADDNIQDKMLESAREDSQEEE